MGKQLICILPIVIDGFSFSNRYGIIHWKEEEVKLDKIKYEETPHSYCEKCGSLVWGEYLDKYKLKEDLIKFVAGFRLKELLEGVDCEEEISKFKNEPYSLSTNEDIVVNWDDDCETKHLEYVENILSELKRIKPYNIKVDVILKPKYKCGGWGVYVNIEAVEGITTRSLKLKTNNQLLSDRTADLEKNKVYERIKKLGDMVGELVSYKGEPYILIKTRVDMFERVLIRKYGNQEGAILVSHNEIKPYKTAHENLISRGYKYIKLDNEVIYTNNNSIIRIDFNNNTYYSNINMDLKTTRIMHQYQTDIRNKVFKIENIK